MASKTFKPYQPKKISLILFVFSRIETVQLEWIYWIQSPSIWIIVKYSAVSIHSSLAHIHTKRKINRYVLYPIKYSAWKLFAKKTDKNEQIKFTNWLPTKLPKVCNSCNVCFISVTHIAKRMRTILMILHCAPVQSLRWALLIFENMKKLFEKNADEKNKFGKENNWTKIFHDFHLSSSTMRTKQKWRFTLKHVEWDTTTITLLLVRFVLCV